MKPFPDEMGILIMKLLVHLILLPFKLLFLLPFIAILAALGLVGLCLARPCCRWGSAFLDFWEWRSGLPCSSMRFSTID